MTRTALHELSLLPVLALFGLGLAVFDGHAARHAGNASLGKKHDSARQVSPIAAPPARDPISLPPPAGERGPAAGWLAGGMFAAMLTGSAFDGIRVVDMAMLALLICAMFFVLRVLRRKPVYEMMQYAALGAESAPSLPAKLFGSAARPVPYPIGFEIDPFLCHAKQGFIHLKAAENGKSLDKIRDYARPEAFRELCGQPLARGSEEQKTGIIKLDAELLELAIDGNLTRASVRFSGLIREFAGAPARPFYEIWNVQKSLGEPESVWRLAGIKQVH